VERRIVANSSIKVVGRLDPAEASRPEYGFLPPSQRGRATLARPGTMFISQPEIPVPLAVEFPFPAWATRLSESAGEPVRVPATGGAAVNGAGSGNGAVRDPLRRLPPVDDEPPF
jgi:DNA helicase HerA-like ATPase